MLWVGVHLAFQTPMARECQVHVAQPVHKHRTPSRRTSLLQTSPHRTITARILLLSRVPDNVPLAIHRYQINSTYPTVSPTTPLIHCNNYLQSDTVINTLKAACIAQPSPATPFPIDPSQIFTLQPPSVYPNSTATSTPAPSSGLSYNAKLAIGITIPLLLLALLSILFLYWYVRIRPRSLKSKSKPHRCQHRGHPSIPSHPNQMSSYSASVYSQQTPNPIPRTSPHLLFSASNAKLRQASLNHRKYKPAYLASSPYALGPHILGARWHPEFDADPRIQGPAENELRKNKPNEIELATIEPEKDKVAAYF